MLFGMLYFRDLSKSWIYPGAFDKWDFLEYALGTRIAFGVNKITKNKLTQNLISKPI